MFLMSAVPLGIGKIKNVFNAQTTGFQTATESASPFLINVNLSINLELVDHAMLDTT